IIHHKQHPNLKFRLKERAEKFTDWLFYTLFDAETPVEQTMIELEKIFEELEDLACWNVSKTCSSVWDSYIGSLPRILELLNLDAEPFLEDDPAAISKEEVYLCYPGFYAIAIYRLAHELHKTGFPMVPRLMTEYAHRLTGVDTIPVPTIGQLFVVVHASG